MKPVRLIIGVVALAAFASCSKKLSTDPLSFAVSTNSTTYHVGDTVQFTFTGNPDIISFYSGEDGHNYDYKSRTTITGTPKLSFTSYVHYGTEANQPNSMQLMVSNDFTGTYDSAHITQATWTNISNRFVFPTNSGQTLASDTASLSDFLAQGKPIYVAFHYTGNSSGTQRTWQITNFSFNLLLADSSTLIPITDLKSAGWFPVNLLATAVTKWSTNYTASPPNLNLAGTGGGKPNSDNWLITKLLYLNSVSPDVAVPIKNITQKVSSYDHVFTQPGTYKVVFLAANATADEQQSVTKEVDLTIQ
ncbi:DUF5017 domain-containing protein [Arachidicoccus soli]|uniref:DUF5017 domain-containing protein n=1 Tax=Arachidicoccus soli TaxID=2341117 RepID=A0A386HPA0_9BACT|nr:DUF5017 domain-containing protein [Arachidicoccus soli]AYD47593.1 DUF5017 domain-containing protein [Arachidicoccus soli]